MNDLHGSVDVRANVAKAATAMTYDEEVRLVAEIAARLYTLPP
jgi:hypothetical protein